MAKKFLCAIACLVCLGCSSGGGPVPAITAGNASGPAGPGTLFVIWPCAPIEVMSKSPKTNWLNIGLPVGNTFYIDGQPQRKIINCDVLRHDLTAGKHNIRIKLAGKSDYGLASDHGLDFSIEGRPKYFVLDGQFGEYGAFEDEAKGQRLIEDVKLVRKQ